MMYFVSYVNTYKPLNNACKELSKWVSAFENLLIKDDCSLDAFHNEIDTEVAMINAKNPRVRKINVHRYDGGLGVKAFAGDNSDYNNVFIISIRKVKGTYAFSERPALEKGGKA